ncbi:hypothetical protein FACS1894186_4260 [Alphaproteobacteria bacterium]|nr:hypothetical protein FACS1894186_4260 [Alphaproteobacteria bacterium]
MRPLPLAPQDYLVDTWRSSDGTSWYRKYASGWIEQGGIVSPASGTPTDLIVNFVVPMSNTNYTFLCTPAEPGSARFVGFLGSGYKTMTGATIVSQYYNTAVGAKSLSWQVIGT